MANKSPRSYQVFNDLIGSKQSTEPIALSIGTGPIVGFDIMDTTKNYFAITGRSRENFTNDQVKAWQKEMGSTPYTRISTKENIAENVVNAYTTPDGMIHVAPALIEFPNIPMDYSLRNTPGQVQCVAVKVKHTYLDQATTVPIPPSSIDFTAVKLNGFVPNMTVSTDVGILYNSTYPELLSILSNYGFTLDPNTEAFVGLYVIGITEGLDDQHVAYYREKDNLTSLVMYGGKWPPILTQNVRDRVLDYINYQYLAGEVLQLNDDIERLIGVDLPNFENLVNSNLNDIRNEEGQKLHIGQGGATLFVCEIVVTASKSASVAPILGTPPIIEIFDIFPNNEYGFSLRVNAPIGDVCVVSAASCYQNLTNNPLTTIKQLSIFKNPGLPYSTIGIHQSDTLTQTGGIHIWITGYYLNTTQNTETIPVSGSVVEA